MENQNQQQTSFSQVPELHKRHFKSFWPIVIIAVLSALVGGLLVWAAFNQGLEDEINSLIPGANIKHRVSSPPPLGEGVLKDWQNYSNKEYGFSFKYPSDWSKSSDSMIISTKEFGYDYQADGNEKKTIPDNYATLLTQTALLPDNLTLSKYASNPLLTGYPCKLAELQKKIISDQEAVECSSFFSEFGASSILKSVFILKSNKIITLTFIVRDELSKEEQDKYFQTFNQILSTLKFVE